MRDQLLINDIHLGVQRVTGTTPASAQELGEYLLNSLEALLGGHEDKDVIINGDLFDTFMVPMFWLLAFYHVARAWLKSSGRKMRLGRGNHDWSKDSAKLSSFDAICQILQAEFPTQVEVIVVPQWLERDIYMIPHMPNQDLFDLELKKAEELLEGTVRGPALLLLHANYDNNFAAESDHSLNVSHEQAGRLIAKGWTLVFGHEHQAREALDGRVVITGNQWPSSVADCLNNPQEAKYAHVIKGGERAGTTIEHIEYLCTWNGDSDFQQVEWQQLGSLPAGARFIRVIGTATAAEAPEMLQAIANFRRESAAFVITNAVKVEGVGEMEELSVSVEEMRAFDVMGYLLDQLDPKQRAVVERLLGRQQQPAQEEMPA